MKLIVQSFIIFFWLSGAASLKAQTLYFRQVSIEQGLPSVEVYDVIQDSKGYMWFATDAGVCRYNGKETEVMDVSTGLSDNTVFSLYEDKKQRIWFRTLSGQISYYAGGSIKKLPVNGRLANITGYGRWLTNSLFTGEGDTLYLCIIAEKGPLTIKISGEQLDQISKASYHYTFQPGSFGDYRLDASRAKDSVLLTMRNGKQLAFQKKFKWRFERFRFYHLSSGNFLVWFTNYCYLLDASGNCRPLLLPDKKSVECVKEDEKGNVWIGLQKGGVYCYQGTRWDLQPRHYLDHMTVSAICTDAEKGMWFSTLEAGVFYAPDASMMQLGDGFKSKANCFYVDHRGHLLFSTQDEELFDVSLNKQGHYVYRKQRFPFRIESITQVGTDYYLGNTLVRLRHLYQSKPDTIFSDAGHLIFGKILENGLPHELFIANHGEIFLKDSQQRVSTIKSPTRIFCAHFTRDKRLLLGCNNGLYEMKNKQMQRPADIRLVGLRINCIRQNARGLIWIGTNGHGLYVYDGKNLLNLNRKNGLAGNRVNAITFDTRGNAWVATYNGISKVHDQLQQFKTENYNISHGLLSNQVNRLIAYNGQLWISTNAGMNICDLNAFKKNGIAPKVAIREIVLNDEKIQQLPAALPYYNNNLHFTFDCLSYRSNQFYRFRYKLKGFDKAWHYSYLDQVNYINLPAGDYELQVYALNNDGVPSREPARVGFTIQSPFWLTWWFNLLLCGVLLLIITLVFRWRIKVLRAREEEKTAINKKVAEFQITALRAQMNPHFIFNAISSVQHYVLKNDIEQSYDYLARFSRLIRLVLDSSGQQEISLAQELDMLHLYIDLEKLRFMEAFEYREEIDPAINTGECYIPAMLVQPYVENAIRHGLMPRKTGGKLSLSVALGTANSLCITIEDNGIGRKKSMMQNARQDHISKGLLLTAERLEGIAVHSGIHVQVQTDDLEDASGQAGGTRVTLHIYLKNISLNHAESHSSGR